MKVPNVYKKYGKKAVALTIAGICILLVITAACLWFLRPSKQSGTDFPQNMSDMFSGLFGTEGTPMSGTGNMVTASGITSVGIIQENFEVENLSQGILIEEVLVSSGQKIAEGDTILKLSEASVAEAREELEDLLKEADLAYRTGSIEYEQSLITAKYDRDQAVLSGKHAQEVYNETVASLTDSVEKAKEQLAQTKEQIAEYQAITANNDYYNVYKVGEYKALYDENLELLKSRMEEWNVSWEQVLSGAGSIGGQSSMGSRGSIGSASSARSVSGGNAVQPQSDPGYATALRALYSVLEQNLQDYEQALADYEDASANAKLTLQTLELSLSSLEQNLTQARINYDSQYLQAKLTLENTLAEAERAENEYETAIQKAESDFETVKDAWEDATDNLALFEAKVGDGYYHADGSGTIMSVMARANQYLSGNGMIFMYRNTEEITVTVSVDQADIASVQVGDSAYVQSSDYGTFSGSVTGVNPVSASGSRANVTYQVTVLLEGDTGSLPVNETVTVIFGMGGAR